VNSAADVTCHVASTAFSHSFSAKRAIPLGCMMAGFGPAGIKDFSTVSAALPTIISHHVRFVT